MITVNLCIFNNPMAGITDQVFFLETSLRNRGYDVSISDRLRKDALNLTIENFRLTSDNFNYVETIGTFCERFGKRIGFILTEHIERQGTQIIFNGMRVTDTDATYIANRMRRFFGLLAQSQFAFGFFTLGSLPELHSFRDIFALHSLYRLPFPALDFPAPPVPDVGRSAGLLRRDGDYDCIFTGAITPYRAKVLAGLRSRFRILTSSLTGTEVEREALYRRAKIALNIPQDPSWGWISPMRIMFGLRVGRPTVHVGGTLQRTEFDRAIPLEEDIAEAVADPAGLYAQQVTGYRQLAREGDARFPDHAFQLWALLENLKAA